MVTNSNRGCCRGSVAFLLVVLMGSAAMAEPGPAVSALNPNRPAPDGLASPTLAGDWRFRVAINGWMPNTILIDARSAAGGGTIEEDLGWLLDSLKYYVPIDLEVRKGSFGFFFHTLALGLKNDADIIGPIRLDWNVDIQQFDVGLSYEVGRWRLWDEPMAPELTLEPYLEARIIHMPMDITIAGAASSETLSSQVPVVGARVTVDLNEHWNLEFIGDYGGWGVDDNHQTWQGAAYLGYRWPGWGAHWNLQVGYRAMGLFEMRQTTTDISMDARGANVTFGVEF